MIFYYCKKKTPITRSKVINEEGKFALDAIENNPNIENTIANLINNKLTLNTESIETLTNWNTLTKPGVWLLNNAPMIEGSNCPQVGEYKFGLLIVLISKSNSEQRGVQIYIPHQPNKHPFYFRTWNTSSSDYDYIITDSVCKWRYIDAPLITPT